MNLNPDQIERFWRGVRRGGPRDCWPWRTGRAGLFSYRDPHGVQHLISVSRVAFWIANGEIPYGVAIRHRCATPWCCNPDHLYAYEHPEQNVNTYVLVDGPQVVGVRSTLPGAIRLADMPRPDDPITDEWSEWEELGKGEHWENAWRRTAPATKDGEVPVSEQRIELHFTGPRI